MSKYTPAQVAVAADDGGTANNDIEVDTAMEAGAEIDIKAPNGDDEIVGGREMEAEANDPAGVPGLGPNGVDMAAHIGLRGLLAVWVTLFHLLHYSELRLPFMPYFLIVGIWVKDDYQPAIVLESVPMIWFFLLSGFSLTVVYAGRIGAEGKKAFWQNRFARIMPLYLVTSLLGSHALLTGHLYIPPPGTGGGSAPAFGFGAMVFFAFVPVCTWLGWPNNPNFNGPAWFVSTIAAFYVAFPLWTLRKVRAKAANLFGFFVRMGCLQYYVALGATMISKHIWEHFVGFQVATWWPVSRYPARRDSAEQFSRLNALLFTAMGLDFHSRVLLCRS